MRLCTVAFALGLLLATTESVLAAPLTAVPGDVERGRSVVLDRERGHCLLCHRIEQLDDSFQGTIGPALSNVARRLTAEELRSRLIDPTRLNPDTVMPAYFRVDKLRQVGAAYRGQTILSAQEIEDVVAYLGTLQVEPGSMESGARRPESAVDG